MYRETNAIYSLTNEQRKALYGVFVVGIRPPRILVGTPYVTSIAENGDPVLSRQAFLDFDALMQNDLSIDSMTGEIIERPFSGRITIDLAASPFSAEQEARIREIVVQVLRKALEQLWASGQKNYD